MSSSTPSLDIFSVFRALPGLYLILSPDFIILEASDSYLAATYKTRAIIGRYVFDVFLENPQAKAANTVLNLQQSLQLAIELKVPQKMTVQRYDMAITEEEAPTFEERYWQPLNTPVLDPAGHVQYLIHHVEDVTEALKQKEEHDITKGNMMAFIESSGGVSWDYDVKSGKFFWSKNFEETFGYPAPEEGETPGQWDARVHPQDYQALRESLNLSVQKQEKAWTGKYRFLKADGTYVHVIDHGYILYDEDGLPYRMLGTLINIDYQQATERLAKESLERFELLAKATNDVIWDWNLTNDFIWWNDGLKVTFGYTEEDIEHDVKSWYHRLHPEDAERVVAGIHKVIDHGGTTWQDEYRFKKADGTYADILDRGIVARNEAGQAMRMIGAMLDITEKNRVAAELKASEQHVRALLEGVPEIAWVARPDGSISYYNKAWYAYTGKTGQDYDWQEVVHPEDLDTTINVWAQALKTGNEYMNEGRLKRASDGAYHWFTMRATPLYGSQGEIQAWIGVNTNIQGQKNIQQKLKDRDAYVQRMLAQAPVQFAVLKGEDWVVDFATPQFTQLVGGRNTVGRPFKEALPELGEQGFFRIIEHVYATGKLFRGNEAPAHLDRTGTGTLELGYFDFSYQPLLNEAGVVEGVMILIVEVTEQVQAKQQAQKLADALQASYDRQTQILDVLPHMTFTSQPNGYIDYYSQQWYDFLGTTRDTLIDLGWESYLHPEDVPVTLGRWQQSLSTGHHFMVENRWRANEGGAYRWFLVRAIPVRDDQGNISMWVGSHTDIHEQKQTQLALQEITQHFQFLADSMPQLVWTTDPQGYHDYFNQKWVEYTGYDLEASKGTQMWNNLLHPDDRERSARRWKESLETGKPYQIEYRFKRASDGEWRWFLGRALPLRDHNSHIVRWFGTCTDIEEQKRDEERMEQTNQELRSINEDLDSFVYTASHDLKLPIINMAGIFRELTQNATFADPDAQLLINMFNKSLKQINATISDLSEIVKVQKAIDARQELVDFSELTEEVQLSIKDMIKQAGAQIHTDFSQAPSLYYSRVNLRSIVYNLVSNAVKYRSPDRTPQVYLHTRQEDGYTVLTIRDNGLGMDLERYGSKIFQMFKRFHDHVEGSGLGLYILNRIVQKNGGRIAVDSQENVGTTFTIYFRH